VCHGPAAALELKLKREGVTMAEAAESPIKLLVLGHKDREAESKPCG